MVFLLFYGSYKDTEFPESPATAEAATHDLPASPCAAGVDMDEKRAVGFRVYCLQILIHQFLFHNFTGEGKDFSGSKAGSGSNFQG